MSCYGYLKPDVALLTYNLSHTCNYITIIIIICNCNYVYYLLLFYISSRTIVNTNKTTIFTSHEPVLQCYKRILQYLQTFYANLNLRKFCMWQ
jgi:hypothetical protein